MDAQSGETSQSASVDKGNQAPEVDVTNNEARCDMTNLQPAVTSNQQIGTSTYVELTFTNEGNSCWVSGFPQVLFASGGATVSEAVRDGEDPGNVYTIPQGGRVGVTLTAESVDGVDGCTPATSDQVDIFNTDGSGSTSLQLSLSVCQNIASRPRSAPTSRSPEGFARRRAAGADRVPPPGHLLSMCVTGARGRNSPILCIAADSAVKQRQYTGCQS